MKKSLLVLVLLAAAAAAFYFYRHNPSRPEEVAAWLPADTAVFQEMPDLHRTEKRWPETALAQILHEPQVQAFLDKPKGKMPGREELGRRRGQLQKIDPTRFFVAFADVSGSGQKTMPKIVLGLAYAGAREDAQALVDELRQAAQKTWPAGKSDVAQYNGGEVETFTVNGVTGALAYRGHWVFLATDQDLLKSTIDGYEGKTAAGTATLRDADAFKKCLAQLPPDSDNLIFVQPKLLADALTSLMMMASPEGDPHQMDYLRKIDAYAMVTKMDGALMREDTFILQPPPADSGPLENNALKLATPNTILFASGGRHHFDGSYLSQMHLDSPPVQQFLAPYAKAFQSQGLTMDQFGEAFGPESGILVDWPPGAPMPAPLASLDVHDVAKARKFLDSLTALPADAPVHLTQQQVDGVTYYSLPPTGFGFFPLQVTMALTDQFALLGLSQAAVQDAVKRSRGPGGLAGAEPYKDAMALVQPPTQALMYMDLKGLFERVYNLARGVASMGMIPHSGDFVDLAKLPETETIAKHLGPLVVSSAARGGGTLGESAGPVTPSLAGGLVGLTAGLAAVPYLQAFGHGAVPATPSVFQAPTAPAVPAPAMTPAPMPSGPGPAATPAPSASTSGTTP